MYIHPVTMDLSFRGRYWLDLTFLDYADYEAAKTKNDPVLPPIHGVVEPKPEWDTKENHDVIGGVTQAAPKAEQLAPSPKEVSAETISKELSTPILAQSGETVVLTDPAGVQSVVDPTKPGATKGDVTTLAGSAGTAAQISVESPSTDKKKKKYAKKLDDKGTIIEVIQLEADEEIKPPYVPATQEEYEQNK